MRLSALFNRESRLAAIALSFVFSFIFSPSLTGVPCANATAAGNSFIALSESGMIQAGARAFCRQKNGRLPRINNSDLWDGQNPLVLRIPIDGFGYGIRPWNETGLPEDIHGRTRLLSTYRVVHGLSAVAATSLTPDTQPLTTTAGWIPCRNFTCGQLLI